MLSSAMVSVLAPHWSRRNQRTKKDFEAQNLGHGPHSGAQPEHNRFLDHHRQFRGDSILGDGPLVEGRDLSVGPRRRADGWSSLSGPSSLNLNFTAKRLTPLSVSFDMDSRSLDNRDTVGTHAKTPPPLSSLSLDLHSNDRRSPGDHQGLLTQPSSKPTTSSLLLSLRKIGSTWKSPSVSETSGRSLTVSNRERVAVPSNPNSSCTSPNNNPSERWTPRPYPSHVPYGPDKSNPNSSQTTSVTNVFRSALQKQTSTGQPGRQERKSISDSNTDPSRLSQYEQYAILTSQTLPRGTTLRSESWWKRVTQEGGSQPSPKDTANIINNNRNETDRPLAAPVIRNRDLASLSPNDNRSFNRQIPNQEDHSKAEAMRGGAPGLVFQRHKSPDALRRSNAEERPALQSDTFSGHSKGFNLNEKQSQPPHCSLSEVNKANVNISGNQNVYSLDKSHRTANAQAALLTLSPISGPTDMGGIFTENTFPKIQNENQSIHTFKKQSQSLDTKDTLGCRVPNPASSQDSGFKSTSLTRSTYKKPQPLVFERTYPMITKQVHPKTLSLYQSTLSPKTSCGPLLSGCTSPTKPSTTPASTATTSMHLTPPVTVPAATSPTLLASSSFLLTPPLTPTPALSPSPKSSLSKKARTSTGSLDVSSRKQSPKDRRRVTWQDSVDLQKSEDDKIKAALPPTPSPTPKTSPLPPTRSPRSLESPSIFSFLREGSPTEARKSSPICFPTPKTTSLKAQRDDERSRQTASDNPASPMEWTSEQRERLSTSPGPGTRSPDMAGQSRASTTLSLPSDFSYQRSYSSPPYSTLKAARTPQGEARSPLPISPPGFQQQALSPSSSSRPSSLSPDPAANRTSPRCQRSPDVVSPSQIMPLPFPNRSVFPEGSKCDALRLKEAESSRKHNLHSNKNTKLPQEDNKAVIGSECLSLPAAQQDGTIPASSARLNVIETLIYSLSKGNSTDSPGKTTPRSLIQCESKTRFSLGMKTSVQPRTQNSGVWGDQCHPFNQNADTIMMKEAQFLPTANDQSIKNSRATSWRKESPSRPGDSLPAHQETHVGPDKTMLERAHQGIDKMDGHRKLTRQFAARLSDDLTFSPKCNRSSETPSISGSSDGNNRDITVKSNDTLQEDKEATRMEVLGDTRGDVEKDRWKQNRYTLVPTKVLCSRNGDHFSSRSDITPEAKAEKTHSLSQHPFTEREAREERTREAELPFTKSDSVSAITSQTQHRDPNPRGQSPGDGPSTPPLCTGPNNRPHSPFAPLSSARPLSPFLPANELEDSVFYSAGEMTPLSGEMGRSVSPFGTARRKMSTSPSTAGPGQETERLPSYSSCADLKYGLQATRSFPVSSVGSSRRLGSERISKGLRVLSMDDLSDPAPLTTKYKCQSMGDQEGVGSWRLSTSPGEIRSRSLPRSLTKSLSCWSSGASPATRQSPTTSPRDRLSSPRSGGADHFQCYSERVLTPPPSPQSPVALLMSSTRGRSPLLSSPGSPRDGLSVRGILPTTGAVASLSDCDESSDSSSDSTTDDEYYLEPEEDDDKESAL